MSVLFRQQGLLVASVEHASVIQENLRYLVTLTFQPVQASGRADRHRFKVHGRLFERDPEEGLPKLLGSGSIDSVISESQDEKNRFSGQELISGWSANTLG